MNVFEIRRRLALLCGIALVGFASAVVSEAQDGPAPASAPRRPSVILIIADGLGYGDLGCYGQSKIQTPRLDQLASQGVRFTQFYAGGGDRTSATIALMMGRVQESGLSSDVKTLGELLKAAGYHTGFIGDWGLAGFDTAGAAHRRGFDDFAGYGSQAHANDLYADHLYRVDPGTGFEDRTSLVDNFTSKKGVYLPDLLTKAAKGFCKINKPQRLNSYRPFFLVLSYPVPEAAALRVEQIPGEGAYSDQSWPAIQKQKAAAMARFDQHVGELLDELTLRGMMDNTIIVVTSTGGPSEKSACDPAFFKSTGAFTPGAESLAEGNLRVPLIVSWPFWMKTGKSSDLLVAAQDIAPTLLQAARLEVPEELEGISILPTLQNVNQTNRHERLSWTLRAGAETQSAIRQGQWKGLQRGADQPLHLYDLSVDPGEAVDVAEGNPELVKQLKAELVEDAD